MSNQNIIKLESKSINNGVHDPYLNQIIMMLSHVIKYSHGFSMCFFNLTFKIDILTCNSKECETEFK